MRLRDKLALSAIIILVAFAVTFLLWPPLGSALDREEMRLGLDLKGGAHLVFEADLSGVENPDEAMRGVIAVIERRIDGFGVLEPRIERVGEKRLLVEIPGIEEIEEATRLIGKTALIAFKEFRPPDAERGEQGNFGLRPDADGVLRWTRVEKGTGEFIAGAPRVTVNGEEKVLELTSKYFEGELFVAPDRIGLPEIHFQWNEEGATLFEQITTHLLDRPLGIFLDDELISAPIVRSILTESGVISGMDPEEAASLAALLNAGRMPVPLTPLIETTISPALGAEFIDWSLMAGIIGLALVILFMILYYRLPGAMAGLALLSYVALVMAIFKLIPITLTLAGIAGFILSIGMAVDANVLIFERMKEEIRTGRTLRAAIEVGFNRAWPAIRDSNISTLIICGILFWMGDILGVRPVMGFAVTLSIGVATSMFSAMVITRTFLRMVGRTGAVSKLSLFVPQSPLLREG
ncbi:protein translocase subunit SecD [Dehalococcoidia bacterium]|nr:protein translocase subunit SecD [Dehalococcoidia bacterium]